MEFKEERGNCLVPSTWTKHPQLFTWVGTQREFRKRKKLSADRIRRLDELKFVWNSKDAAWETMFNGLVQFWKIHRHCNVPQRWPENPKLGAWVNTQRLFKRKRKLSRLTPEKIRLLDEMGFEWERKLSKRFQDRTDTTRTSS